MSGEVLVSELFCSTCSMQRTGSEKKELCAILVALPETEIPIFQTVKEQSNPVPFAPIASEEEDLWLSPAETSDWDEDELSSTAKSTLNADEKESFNSRVTCNISDICFAAEMPKSIVTAEDDIEVLRSMAFAKDVYEDEETYLTSEWTQECKGSEELHSITENSITEGDEVEKNIRQDGSNGLDFYIQAETTVPTVEGDVEAATPVTSGQLVQDSAATPSTREATATPEWNVRELRGTKKSNAKTDDNHEDPNLIQDDPAADHGDQDGNHGPAGKAKRKNKKKKGKTKRKDENSSESTIDDGTKIKEECGRDDEAGDEQDKNESGATKKRKNRKPTPRFPPKDPSYCPTRVFVRNLHKNIRERDIWNFFQKFGTVTHVRKGYKNKPFAFVTFAKRQYAEKVLQASLDKLVCKNRQLYVEDAKDKEKKYIPRNEYDGDNYLAPIDALPDDLLNYVFSFLDIQDRHTSQQVCKRWADVTQDPELVPILHIDPSSS